MRRIKDVNPTNYSDEHYLAAVAQARSFIEFTNQKFDQIQQLTPQWPIYMYEEVSHYEVVPPDPVLQSIIDLGTEIGNFNLRLDALYYALNGPVIK